MERSPTFDSYLKETWRRKGRIVATTVAVALVTAVVSLLLPKTFEATSQLIVLPSLYRPELASPPPEVQTCQMLLTNPRTLQRLHRQLVDGRTVLDELTSHEPFSPKYLEGIQSISAERIVVDTGCDLDLATFLAGLDTIGLLGLADFRIEDLRNMTLESMAESLRADVTEEKKTAIDIIYSPIILLRARGRTGAQAAMLANAWASAFLDVYRDLVRANLLYTQEFLDKKAKEYQAKRLELQTTISKLRRRSNLDFLTAQVDAAKEDYIELRSDLGRQQLVLDSETSRRVALARALDAIEDDGVWIGARVGNVPNEKPGVTGTEREMRAEVLASTRHFQTALAELQEFRSHNDLDTRRKERERAQLDLLKFQSQLREDSVRTDATSQALAAVRKRLVETAPTLVAPNAPGSGTARQILNPVWEELEFERIRLERELAETTARKAKLEPYLRDLATSVAAQDAAVSILEIEFNRLQKNFDLALAEYDAYQEAYAKLKQDMYEANQAIGPLRARVGQIRRAAAQLQSLIEDTNSSITVAQTQLALLQTQDEMLARYVTHTSTQLQEAELAVAQQQLDVKIASEAIPPEKKIWPQRTLMVMVMTFVGLFFSVGVVCLRHYLVATGISTRT